MCRNGTKGATSKTSTVNVDRMANHVVGWNFLFIPVAGVRQASKRKIVKPIDFLFFQRWPRRIYNDLQIASFLYNYIRFYFIRFFLDVHEVFGKFLFILKAFFE